MINKKYMRVIFDTNIFVSYLLTKEDKNTIVSLVENKFAGKFKLLITEDLLEELRKKITHKRYLAKMIKIGDLKDVLMSRNFGSICMLSSRELKFIAFACK